jgi:hypothetical protein
MVISMEVPYDLAIPLLGIYTQKHEATLANICTPMFIVALFTLAQR